MQSASEISTVAKWYMGSGCSVPVLLRDTKTNNEGSLPQIAETHQHILWFDITVNKFMGVDVLEPKELEKQVSSMCSDH
jgi:hypothetical protein